MKGKFQTRWLTWALAAAGAALVTASCEEDPARGNGAESLCGALEGYVSSCASESPCEQAVVRDCDALGLTVAPGYANAVAQCMNELGTPMECLRDSVDLTPATAELEGFAQALCLECGDGAGECEVEVLNGDETTLGRAGRLARTLSTGTLANVQAECATGDACADNFESCALNVISREMPGETASCMVDAIHDRFGDVCEAGGTDSIGSGSDTDSGDSSDPTGDDTTGDPTGNSTDPTDPTDPTDTDGACMDEGCPCMFNEDCGGDLVCVEVCTQPAACEDDPNEPNNGEIQATFLPPIGDNDGDGSQVEGELEAVTDIDWFRFEGQDNFGSVVNPYAQLNVVALELCVYAECLEGLEITNVSCPEGTTQQPSPSGRPGCCGANTNGFEVDLSCGGNGFGDDSAYIYMSVTGSEPGVCQEFTLSYHY